MAYKRVNWEDAPSEKTPLNAENLNVMDQGIENLDKEKINNDGDASAVIVKYTEASSIDELSSGATLATLFSKVAKAISGLISHLADNTAHVTSTERNTWNDKANATHNQAASTITAGTLGGQVKANATAQATLTTAQLRDAVFVAEASAPAVGSTADTSKYPEGCLIVLVEAVS